MQAVNSVDDSLDDLASRIYESVVGDDDWSDALKFLCDMMGACGTGLRVTQQGGTQRHIFAFGPHVTPEALAAFKAHSNHDILPMDLDPGEACTVDYDRLTGNKALQEMVRQTEMGQTLVMCVDRVGNTDYLLNVARRPGSPYFMPSEFAFFKRVGAHFSRAIGLRRKLQRSRVTEAFQAEALDHIGIGGMLIDQDGSQLLLNETMQRFIDASDGLRMSGGRIHTVDSYTDRALQAAIRSALTITGGSFTRAMLIKRSAGKQDLGLVVSSRSSISILSNQPEKSVLIFVRDPAIASDGDVGLLQQLFSFTPTEASLAVGLARGMRLEDVEAKLNIRHNTARAHLRSMFVKADVTRQAELIYLLSNCVTPLGRPAAQSARAA